MATGQILPSTLSFAKALRLAAPINTINSRDSKQETSKMFARFLIAMIVVLSFTTVVDNASALNTANLSREQIRQMPLVERPNRPGHIYGNQVRRVHRLVGGR
jgi:hypothetical protein